MYFLYSFALSILFLLLLPYFIFQGLKHGKYFSNFKERLGHLPDSIPDKSRPTLWLHTVSVGEFNAARPLIEGIKLAFPDYRLVVSTTTMTGQKLARAEHPHKLDAVFYFPFDWKFSVRRALNHIRPSAVIILETELWPNFLHECKNRGVVSLIVNGRISPRSFARYSRIREFISQVLNDVSLLLMQSEGDAERARGLGADSSRVSVCGNLKYDVAVRSQESGVWSLESEVKLPDSKNNETQTKEKIQGPGLRTPDSRLLTPALNEQFNLSSSKHLIVAGSTAPGEEKILLDVLREARHHQGLEDARLLLAPRHPERFNEVANLLAESKFTFARRSEKDRSAPQNHSSQNAAVILLDTIGELVAAYEFAAVVFVGGSLVPKGGHNIIEPAAFAKPIIVGAHTENFRQIISDFAQADAMVQISAKEVDAAKALAQQVIRLLTESEEAQAMGRRARDILLNNRGATDCTLRALQKVMSDTKSKQ
jgi:3-deoxy-D-manno-octulosonic-acid transferase